MLYIASPSRRKLVLIARGRKTLIVKQCFKDKSVMCSSARFLGHTLRMEIAHLCSKGSLLMKCSASDIRNFSWEILVNEMHDKTPVLLTILKESIRTKSTMQSCKYHCASASLVQIFSSVILYAGNSCNTAKTK